MSTHYNRNHQMTPSISTHKKNMVRIQLPFYYQTFFLFFSFLLPLILLWLHFLSLWTSSQRCWLNFVLCFSLLCFILFTKVKFTVDSLVVSNTVSKDIFTVHLIVPSALEPIKPIKHMPFLLRKIYRVTHFFAQRGQSIFNSTAKERC